MKKFAWALVIILTIGGALFASSFFSDRAERMAFVAIVISVYSLLGGLAQAYYARDQAISAKIQASLAEEADSRQKLTDQNTAEPQFNWQVPTGNKDKISVRLENVGGMVQITHAEVASGGTDVPLMIPGKKLLSGESFTFAFQPPDADKVFPIKLLMQFKDCYGNFHEMAVTGENWGKELVELYSE